MTTFYLALCLACGKKKAGPPPGAPAIEVGHAAYVTCNGSDEIAVLDREGDRVAFVSLDVDPDSHEAPHHLAVDSRASRVFVALAYPPSSAPAAGKHAGHGRATQAGSLLSLDLSTLGVVEARDTEQNPGDVVLTRDRSRVLVTHFDMQRAMREAAVGAVPSKMAAALQVWDAKTMTLLASRPICVAPHGVTTTRDDAFAVVACYGSDEMAFVDLSSPRLATSRVPVGASPGVLGAPRYGPYGVALSPDGSVALVSDMESGDVRVLDMVTRSIVDGKTLVLGGKAMLSDFVSPTVALVPLQGPDGLARVSVADAKLEKRVSYADTECKSPHVVRTARDGRVYVVCEGDHVGKGAVLEVDPVTLATKKRWTVGVYPDGIAMGDD